MTASFSAPAPARTFPGSRRRKRGRQRSRVIAAWRLHDLRRTMATRLAELGVPHPVVSKALNHSPRGVMGVTSIYNRYEYLDERREALERWAQRIGDIVSPPPANVVPFHAAAS